MRAIEARDRTIGPRSRESQGANAPGATGNERARERLRTEKLLEEETAADFRAFRGVGFTALTRSPALPS